MNTQRSRFNLNNFKIVGAIAPMAIILVGFATAPLSAQVVRIENRGFGRVYRTPINNSIIYGSPIPAPSITYPSNFYSYPNYYPGINSVRNNTFYSYPSYYPGVDRVRNNTLPNPVLVNPTIRNSTLINPTIIIQPQRRFGGRGRYKTILRPINY